jgi:hypothetical protein
MKFRYFGRVAWPSGDLGLRAACAVTGEWSRWDPFASHSESPVTRVTHRPPPRPPAGDSDLGRGGALTSRPGPPGGGVNLSQCPSCAILPVPARPRAGRAGPESA